MSAKPALYPLDLHSGSGDRLFAQVCAQTSPTLAGVARRLARSFFIHSPFAPGLNCIGGEVALEASAAEANGSAWLSVTGNGETPEAALASCLGETADLLSQFERMNDVAAHGVPGDLAGTVMDGWLAAAMGDLGRSIDWVAAVEASTGNRALLPADLCLRRRAGRRALKPVGALSSGAAAGADRAGAALRAVLELCERDAAALWWLGGKRARGLPLEHPAFVSSLALIRRLRQGEKLRYTQLLDITTELGVPVIAAISLDGEGRGLACGLAARLEPVAAARAAILEMCQMELSAPVAAAKLAERGEAGLNDADRRHLERAAFAAGDHELLYPVGMSRLDDSLAGAGLEGVVTLLRDRGIDVFLADLSRPDIGICVARAIAPQLQPFSLDVLTQRLQNTRSACDYLSNHTGVMPLL